MVVGGGRESHTREKGVPFAGGTNLLRMDSLRTCACATQYSIIFAWRKSLLFVRLTTTKQQKADLYDPVPVSSFRLVTAIQTKR